MNNPISQQNKIPINIKLKWDKYFYVLMMFLWAGKASPLLSLSFQGNFFTFIIYIIINIAYFHKYCKNSNKQPLLLIFGLFAIWYTASYFKWDGFQLVYFGLFFSIIFAYIAYNMFTKYEFFFYFEKVLIHLCILSLVVWGTSLILPNLVENFMDSISVGSNGNTQRANFFVVGLGNQFVNGIRRNIGFTWEAGRFSSFIVLGIFVHLTLYNMRIRCKNFYILIITLLSTISTTGIGAAGACVLYYFLNKGVASKVLLIILCILIIPSLWALPFINEKIFLNLNVEQEVMDMAWIFENTDRAAITPQRFTGLYLEFQNFIHDPLLGYNLNENSYTVRSLFRGFDVWLSNGILQIFSMYGIFIGIFFYYNLIKSSILITKEFNKKGSFIFFLIFLLISISYEFWTASPCLYFIFYYLFSKYIPKKQITYK